MASLIYRLRRFFGWLWKQEGSPGYRARGLAIGVFCGCFPFLGLQTLFGLALASLLRGNPLLAASGTWISNPATYLPLYWLNYRVGAFLLGEKPSWNDFGQFAWQDIWHQGWFVVFQLALGSLSVGFCSSLSIGLFVFLVLKGRRSSKSKKMTTKRFK